MIDINEWWQAIERQFFWLAKLAVPGEEELLKLVTCDGHALHMTTLGALRGRALALAGKWNRTDQDSGDRIALIQELITLFGLMVNARRLEFWEVEPAVELREETR